MVRQRVDGSLCLFGVLACNESIDTVRDVLLVLHERHEHIFIGQFLDVVSGIESVLHVVVFNGGMGIYRTEATVMVGEHKSIRRHDDTRAES